MHQYHNVRVHHSYISEVPANLIDPTIHINIVTNVTNQS